MHVRKLCTERDTRTHGLCLCIYRQKYTHTHLLHDVPHILAGLCLLQFVELCACLHEALIVHIARAYKRNTLSHTCV